MNSNAIRDLGFEEVLSDFPKEEVERLLYYHKSNGGLSRYVKFRYFFEEIRGERITDEEIKEWANRFSVRMKELLIDSSLLIEDTINFVQKYHSIYPMHIVSGSDGIELRYLCDALKIDKYFVSISGSPTPKTQIVSSLIVGYGYDRSNCVLIGDSINDYEAAKANGIVFYGYNNQDLQMLPYLSSMDEIEIINEK